MDCRDTLLQSTRSFWNANPCDGQVNVLQRMKLRYNKEPWLPRVLDGVAQHNSVLEVGCGQGTDALYCCERMRKGATYTAVDYSERSLESAKRGAAELRARLSVVPEFIVDNAESLDCGDDSFDCVISIGVLHHTPNAGAAVDEIHRVLRKGGTAYVALYRFIAPKVLAARSIRFIARGVDRVAGRDKYLYRLCGQLGSNHFLGTMLLECLGVPILCSYTKGRVREMFGRFESVTIHPVGFGLPLALSRWMDRGTNPLGTLWLIKATKNAH